MSLHYRILILFILVQGAIWFVPVFEGIRIWLSSGLLLIYIALLVWGVSTISSGLFLKAICSFPEEHRSVAVTFDDGPDHERSPWIMDQFESRGWRCSFFLVGSRISGNEEIIKEIYSRGHSTGNHSWSHGFSFPLKRARAIREDIYRCNVILRTLTGQDPRFFRPPFGVTNPRVARGMKGTGLSAIGWNIRSYDTRGEDPARVLRRIRRKLKPGAIILLHEDAPRLPEILPALLEEIQNRGWICESLDDLLT